VGTYELQAQVGRLVAPKQKIEVGEDGYQGPVYLGEADWPFYRLGRTAIPFAPQHDIVAVMPRQGVKDAVMSTTLNRIIRPARLKPLEARGDENDRRAGRSAIRLYKAESGSTFQDLHDKLRKSIGSVARVGLPVDVRSMVQALNTWLIRFRSGDPLANLATVESWHEEGIRYW